MTSLRPGTLEARELYKSNSCEEWLLNLRKYHQTIQYLTKYKSSANELSSLDNFLWNNYVETIQSRQPTPYLTVEELSMIMKWKLTRGKFRPLQKLVESNQNTNVINISTKAFKYLLEDNNWEKAVNTIIELKGIGVATASAVFAPLKPTMIPFMADEVIEATCNCKRDYTLKIYRLMRDACIAKATKLLEEGRDGTLWTAENVGKALWVKAMITIYPDINNYKISDKIQDQTTSNNNDCNNDNRDKHNNSSSSDTNKREVIDTIEKTNKRTKRK